MLLKHKVICPFQMHVGALELLDNPWLQMDTEELIRFPINRHPSTQNLLKKYLVGLVVSFIEYANTPGDNTISEKYFRTSYIFCLL